MRSLMDNSVHILRWNIYVDIFIVRTPIIVILAEVLSWVMKPIYLPIRLRVGAWHIIIIIMAICIAPVYKRSGAHGSF